MSNPLCLLHVFLLTYFYYLVSLSRKNFIKQETYANHISVALLLAGCNQAQASSSPLTALRNK